MITRFQDKTKDKLFYTPSVAGPEGKLPFAGTNTGGDNRIKSFKEFAGEYRKGSKKYGKLVSRLMEFLRLPEFKTKIEENDSVSFNIGDFEARSHIKIDEISQLLTTDHNLYNFDIKLKNNTITFYGFKTNHKGKWFEV